MIILPAIDILDGKCVRLTRGAYDTAQKVAADPIETAQDFVEQGAEFIHLVDLDGAREGSRKNSAVYEAIVRTVPVPVELGGGIRDMETVDYYLSKGIQRVILGSAAVRDPEFVKRAADRYGDRIAVGIDALNGYVKTAGWLEETDIHYITLAKMMQAIGIRYIIYTDISKDGTLSEPNYEELKSLQDAVSVQLIASGGIRDLDNIKKLRAMNLYGAICGKSIYSGTLSLTEAIQTAK